MEGCDYGLVVVDVLGAFLYGKMRTAIYIELPTQDERYGGKNLVGKGKLVKAMYGTRDAPQIWGDLVQETMAFLVVAHVVPEENFTWLFEGLSAKFQMTKTIVCQSTHTR